MPRVSKLSAFQKSLLAQSTKERQDTDRQQQVEQKRTSVPQTEEEKKREKERRKAEAEQKRAEQRAARADRPMTGPVPPSMRRPGKAGRRYWDGLKWIFVAPERMQIDEFPELQPRKEGGRSETLEDGILEWQRLETQRRREIAAGAARKKWLDARRKADSALEAMQAELKDLLEEQATLERLGEDADDADVAFYKTEIEDLELKVNTVQLRRARDSLAAVTSTLEALEEELERLQNPLNPQGGGDVDLDTRKIEATTQEKNRLERLVDVARDRVDALKQESDRLRGKETKQPKQPKQPGEFKVPKAPTRVRATAEEQINDARELVESMREEEDASKTSPKKYAAAVKKYRLLLKKFGMMRSEHQVLKGKQDELRDEVERLSEEVDAVNAQMERDHPYPSMSGGWWKEAEDDGMSTQERFNALKAARKNFYLQNVLPAEEKLEDKAFLLGEVEGDVEWLELQMNAGEDDTDVDETPTPAPAPVPEPVPDGNDSDTDTEVGSVNEPGPSSKAPPKRGRRKRQAVEEAKYDDPPSPLRPSLPPEEEAEPLPNHSKRSDLSKLRGFWS